MLISITVTTITQFIKPPPYSLNDTDASLFYLAPIVGSIVGELWGHWFNDFLCNRYIRTHDGKYEPENRLWGAYPGAILAIASLVLYGQTLQHTLPVIGLAAAWAIMAFAQVSSTTAISAYALDCFPHHAALASSWINFWRTTGMYPIFELLSYANNYRRFLRYLLPNSMGCKVRSCSYLWRSRCHRRGLHLLRHRNPDLWQEMEGQSRTTCGRKLICLKSLY